MVMQADLYLGGWYMPEAVFFLDGFHLNFTYKNITSFICDCMSYHKIMYLYTLSTLLSNLMKLLLLQNLRFFLS